MVRNGLVFWLEPVDSFRFKAPFTAGDKLPFQRTALRIERIESPIVATDINGAALHRGRGRRRATGCAFPNLPAILGVDRVNVAVVAGEVEHLAAGDRGRKDAIAGTEFPFDAMKLSRRGSRINTGMCRVAAEHGLRGSEMGRAKKYYSDERRSHGVWVFGATPRWKTSGISSGP